MYSKFCIPLDFIPSLDEKSHNDILNWYEINKKTFYSHYQENGKTVRGFKNFDFFSQRTFSSEEDAFAKNILESNNILINYDRILFLMQRGFIHVPPHTDPGRTVTLLYNIQGSAISNFYEMENFIPDIDYSLHNLTLVESITMKLKKWYLFNNSAIHSVGRINNHTRIAFGINLTERFRDFEDAKDNILTIFKTL